MQTERISRVLLVPLVVVSGLMMALAACDSSDPFAPETGVWHGYADGREVVTLYIDGGAITSTGSTLEHGASLIIKLPYSGVTITNLVYDEIAVSGNHFTFSRGNQTSVGGRLEIEGTFQSSTRLSGTVTHNEDSSQARANMNYDWTAEY